jgi:hypothetical protein
VSPIAIRIMTSIWQNQNKPVEPNDRAAAENRCTQGLIGPELYSVRSEQLTKPLLYP